MEKGKYIGLKNHFSHFVEFPYREHQEEAVDFIINSKKEVVVIQAPTGSGKSLVGMSSGSNFFNFTYLVSSKQLQAQLKDDFPEVKVMQGRGNYECAASPDLTCDDCVDGTLIDCKYPCPYEMVKKEVLASKWRLLNYSYYLFETNYVGKFKGTEIVICDEGDLLETILADFISLSVPGRVVERLDIKPPKYVTAEAKNGVESWIEWANFEAREKIGARIDDLEIEIDRLNMGHPQLPRLVKELKSLDGIIARIKIFLENVSSEWIFEKNEKTGGYAFKPIWIPKMLADQFFFNSTKKFVLMSATFPPAEIMAKTFGKRPSDFDYYEIPSTFPVENRRVYIAPKGDLTYKTFKEEAPKVIRGIETIVDRHKNEKGLIHAVSYKLSKMIMGINGTAGPRLVTHGQKDREEVLGAFKASSRPLVLVSPSMERGVDLPDDLCQFIIFAKCPFLSLADKLVNKRVFGSNIGGLWYRSLCAQTIVQGCGRGVRHKNDKCVTYLLDKQIFNLITGNKWLFPNYFLEAIEI